MEQTTQTRPPDARELLDAVQQGDLDLVTRLVERGADLNVASGNGWTPLMLAALNDSLALARLLLVSGADPGVTTVSEENPCRSPLAVAISNGRVEMVRLLMAHGADPTTAPGDQPTPLSLARKLAHRPLHREQMAQIVRLLENT